MDRLMQVVYFSLGHSEKSRSRTNGCKTQTEIHHCLTDCDESMNTACLFLTKSDELIYLIAKKSQVEAD